MYVMVGLLLTVASIIELEKKRTYNKFILSFALMFLTAILAFRYGQGSDYYGYFLQFNGITESASLLVNSLYHGEIGWYIILVLAKRVGMNFESFIGIISLIMMFSIGRAIKKHSPYGFTSLFLFYPTFYLTYCFSAMRQGLVMCLFLGFGLDFLFEKKYVKYYVLNVVLITFHRSAIFLLLLPLLLHFKNKRIEKYFLLAIVMSLLLGYSGILNQFATRIGIVGYFNVSISVMAIFLRLILFYIVYRLHRENRILRDDDNSAKSKKEEFFYFIYLIGFVFYITLAFAGTLSQRLTMPFKAVEVLLLPLLIQNLDTTKTRMLHLKFGKFKILAMVMALVLMINVELVKNINSYIVQGNYYSWVNPINYPYSSIFDKDSIRSFITHFDEEVE